MKFCVLFLQETVNGENRARGLRDFGPEVNGCINQSPFLAGYVTVRCSQ